MTHDIETLNKELKNRIHTEGELKQQIKHLRIWNNNLAKQVNVLRALHE